MYRIRGSLALAIVCFSCAVAEGMTQLDGLTDQNKPKRCSHERVYDMSGAYCVGLRLQHIPSLKSGIEILDFSENRLQELKADTFSSYTSIKFLYLAENQMYNIDKDAFAPLSYLQTLDLSNNVILNLPESIFQLPSLRKLYLKDNPLLHLSFTNLQLHTPIKAPLELLDISNCKIDKLPYWGTLPHLTHYNISYNLLTALEAKHFASMCKLEKVDLTKSLDKIKLCDLKPTINWLQDKNVYFQLDDYSKLNTKEFEKCDDMPQNFVALNITHHVCKTAYLEFQSIKTSRRTWLTVTGGLAGFLVGFMLLLYLMHRHNVAQTKTKAEKLKKATPAHDRDKQATVPILVNDSNDVSRL
ncbi:tsukushin isoform X2 [Ostrinia furnacalis]|uniref:tsukushin isoform X2 n=1 Tax=Ostrinia furnacalis TaxID=93504 RepID=UPI00103B6628|nr:tsukushin isoform X2 [Ostrinia furnacalis]